MDFDFTTTAPKPNTLAKCHQLIEQLWSHCVDLTSSLSKLKDQMNTNSSNSSLPPSNDSIKDKASKRKEHDGWRKHSTGYWRSRRQGAQPGHKGTGRSLLAVEEVDEVIPCHPDKVCDACEGGVKADCIRQRKQVFDLPLGALQVTEYQIYGGRCLQCKKKHRGALPPGTPSGILSTSALAKIAALTGKYRLSKREVKAFLYDFFGLTVCVGSISNAEKRVSDSLKQPVNDIGEELKGQSYLHVDETGHNHKGHLEWLWVATTQKLTYFKIYQHRNQTCAKALIGEAYSGMVITDRYGAYNWLPASQRQYCWAHLKRDFKKLSERENLQEAFIGSCLLGTLESMFHHWRKVRNGAYKPYWSFLISAIKRLYNYLKRGRKLTGTKTSKLCVKLIRERKSLWHFLRMEYVNATNNHAERQLRHGVIWRKKCYGTQSKRGIHFVERILTVVKTCEQQNRNLIDWLRQSIEAHWQNTACPSFII